MAQAKRLVMKHTPVLDALEVGLLDARNMVLAKPVRSDMNIPPMNNSAMDGFAVRAEDQAGATKNNPAVLKVVGVLPAGKIFEGRIKKGEALRIMTGAPMPKGADSVVRQEDTSLAGKKVSIFVPVVKGKNVRLAGEDVGRGETVARAGEILTPARLGVIASAGPSKVKVHRRPVAAVLATGDEVVDAGIKPGPGQIRSSNSYTMYHQVAGFGAIPINLGIARDNKRSIKSLIKKATREADILLTSGGISVGKFDYVGQVLQELGFKEIFYKVKQRPGQPLAFGKLGKTYVFALPGNPVSGMVCALQYVRPAIRKMMGHKILDLPETDAILDENVTTRKDRTYFLRGLLVNKKGTLHVSTAGLQGSGMLQSMSQANALVLVPANRTRLKKGEKVRVQLLEGTSWTGLY